MGQKGGKNSFLSAFCVILMLLAFFLYTLAIFKDREIIKKIASTQIHSAEKFCDHFNDIK